MGDDIPTLGAAVEATQAPRWFGLYDCCAKVIQSAEFVPTLSDGPAGGLIDERPAARQSLSQAVASAQAGSGSPLEA